MIRNRPKNRNGTSVRMLKKRKRRRKNRRSRKRRNKIAGSIERKQLTLKAQLKSTTILNPKLKRKINLCHLLWNNLKELGVVERPRIPQRIRLPLQPLTTQPLDQKEKSLSWYSKEVLKRTIKSQKERAGE